MSFHRWIAAALLLGLIGCGAGPVPSGMYLTLSVSTRDAAVETSINGKTNEFLSGGTSGSMIASAPLNKLVHAGENTAAFALTAVQPEGNDAPAPALLATLEISVTGETVDTREPGERVMFSRELTEEEAAALVAGETVAISETFTVDPAALQAIMDGGAQ